MSMNSDQIKVREAFVDFLYSDEKTFTVCARPGRGKSWMTRELVKVARSHSSALELLIGADNKINIKMTATTNKAAKVLSEFSGMEATTIHSLIGRRYVQS